MNGEPPAVPEPLLGRRIAVVGLGHVGLPVAAAFGVREPVIAFDSDPARVEELRRGVDRNASVAPARLPGLRLEFTDDASDLGRADFFIVTVPTPVDEAKRPDLGALESASRTVGGRVRPGGIVVYESTVYPGATEDVCIPILEDASNLCAGRDFFVAYSPERINPGDEAHDFARVVKVVSAGDPDTLETVARVYESVVEAGVHRAPSIRVAEAAKVIENTQRDINIALMNEFAMILDPRSPRDRYRGRARGGRVDEVELPSVPAGPRGGTLHRRRPLLPHPRGLAGRPSPRGHPLRPPDQRRDRVVRRVERRAAPHPDRRGGEGRGGDGARRGVQGERSRRAQFRRGPHRPREFRTYGALSALVGVEWTCRFTIRLRTPLESARTELGIELTRREDLHPARAVVLAVAHEPWRREDAWTLVGSLLDGGTGQRRRRRSAPPLPRPGSLRGPPLAALGPVYVNRRKDAP